MLLLLAVTDSSVLLAQSDAGGYRIGQVYTDKFPQIGILIDVSPSQGAKVKQIAPNELHLVEDSVESGRPTGLSTFKDTGRGMAIVIVVDVSPSMNGGPLNAIRDADRNYVT